MLGNSRAPLRGFRVVEGRVRVVVMIRKIGCRVCEEYVRVLSKSIFYLLPHGCTNIMSLRLHIHNAYVGV